MSIKVLDSPTELVRVAGADFAKLASELLSNQPSIKVLLTGGTLGIEFVAEISKLNVDWSRVWLMFSDERFVSLTDSDRNEHQGIQVWPELAELINRFPSNDLELEVARDATNQRFLDELGPIDAESAVFDLTVLGMGPDAHIASLFPGHQAQGEWVIAESDSPKPPAQRLSLSYQALNRSERVWFLAAGEAKRWAVTQSMDTQSGLPASKVRGKSQTVWYLDKEITDAL